MSSDWQKLADLWYRKREVYATHWQEEPDRLHLSVVAGAPYGGPVATVRDEHVFQPVRGSMKPELQTWTSAGRPIASCPWVYSGLISMGWSSQEVLVCVFDSGVVRTFTVMCEELARFTVDERIKTEGNAIHAALWSDGVALLTRRHSLFVNCSFERAGDACYRCADLKLQAAPSPAPGGRPGAAQAQQQQQQQQGDVEPPLCLCVIPPPHEDSADVQVLIGTAQGPVLLADRHQAVDLGFDEGPYNAFAVSSSGRLLAALSTRGVFKVFAVNNLTAPLDVANIECRKKPKQMVWCGDDCIALYLVVPTPSSSLQHVLFVGGPQNDWIPYQYDSPLHLVSECDGCRILGSQKVEFVQRVPHSTEAIYSIGNCDPPAMLCYALERFEKGDVCAQESLRLIKDDLADAVATCVDAASFEHEAKTVQDLLQAAVFGRHFLTDPVDPAVFVQTCRNLRICIALRKEPIDIPLTVPQLDKLGFAGLTSRLAGRREHFLAVRICEWVGHPKDRVLFHWACEKIKHAKTLVDEQLCEAILGKFRGCRGVPFAEVARVAAEMHRPHLATMLLNHEPRGHAQVRVLMQLSLGGDEDSRMMMLKLAVEKACLSCDPDLLYGVISNACGGDPCGPGVDLRPIAQLVRDRPHEMQIVADYLVTMLRKGMQQDEARRFHASLGRSRQAALCAAQQVLRSRDLDERKRMLADAKAFFTQVDPNAIESERYGMNFSRDASAEEELLIKKQEDLEEKSVTERWRNGPHRFVGLSVVDTLRKLIELGEISTPTGAEKLRTDMKVSDKRYWRIKIRAMSDAGDISGLNDLATYRSSPVGYELFVEAFMKHDRADLAKPLVAKVKNPEQQATYYYKMGMEQEANEVMRKERERAQGPGRFIQNIFQR